MEPVAIEQRGPGAISLPVVCPSNELRAALNAWARRISAALTASLGKGQPVRWWEDGSTTWIAVGPEERPLGRVRLRSDPDHAGRIVIESMSAGASETPAPFQSFFSVLFVLAAIAGLVLWIWLVVQDRDRIWNRLSFSDAGDRATKLEIFLLLIGWVVCPVLACLPVALLQHALGGLLAQGGSMKAGHFVTRELNPVLTEAVTAACAAALDDKKTRVDLGLARPSL